MLITVYIYIWTSGDYVHYGGRTVILFWEFFWKRRFSTKPHYVFILFIYLPFNKIHLTELEWIMVATETICISSFIKMFCIKALTCSGTVFHCTLSFFLSCSLAE